MYASIYSTGEVLVIDFTHPEREKQCFVTYYDKSEGEVMISFIRRNWVYIYHGDNDTARYFNELDPNDPESIVQVQPQYIETVEGHWKPYFFGAVKKWIPATLRVKAGWVELHPSPEKLITTTKYRIIQDGIKTL